jgi:soluble cytochrome b562
MKKLSPSARRLFELARGQDDPDELSRNRVGRALSAKIAAGVTAVAASASAPAAAGLGAIALKSVLVASVTGALVTAGWVALRPHPPADVPATPSAPAPVVSQQPAPTVELPEETTADPQPASTGKEARRAAVVRRPARALEHVTASTSTSIEDRLHAETEALRTAQRALRDKLPEQALRMLDEQDASFRDGLLFQERAAARILALCQLGRVDDARARATRFEKLWPRSPLLGRIRLACW